ncbi:YceK/YidQ family lipoprotein [Marinobacter sp.]|uniref:YceK/YidQ family lipoprotein n=1 Tax=Marinobacter sp. TaxID=50741 RepID=UPI003A8F978E
MYSGVAYDYCWLHGSPSGISNSGLLSGLLFDIPASAIADTIVLPYTLHQQYTKGHIPIKR